MMSRLFRCAVLLALLAAIADCGESGKNGDLLSVDETMGVIFRGSFDYHLFRRANPDAKAEIYAFLDDKAFEGYHPQAIRLLGWIGEAADVVVLRKIIDRLKGTLAPPDDRKLRAVLEAWATMARRGLPGAGAEIEKFCSAKTWSEAAFTWLIPAW